MTIRSFCADCGWCSTANPDLEVVAEATDGEQAVEYALSLFEAIRAGASARSPSPRRP